MKFKSRIDEVFNYGVRLIFDAKSLDLLFLEDLQSKHSQARRDYQARS